MILLDTARYFSEKRERTTSTGQHHKQAVLLACKNDILLHLKCES